MLALYDTLSRQITKTLPDQTLSLYVCGPTVYDVPHLGHGRALLVYDVLRRYLESTGVRVHHVSNVTDVDDNIIERSRIEGVSPNEVVEHYEAEWWKASSALGVARPHDAPHATAYIPQMVELIADLVAKGVAYPASDGVYMDVSSVKGYGSLKHQALDELRAGARVEGAPDKRSPLDFALWKLAKEGEPSWDSPFGAGRPGWHTECVVMSLDLLGEGFDLHAGGMDLIFPHHENERAQAIAAGRGFARHWMHHAFVTAAGEKMSKSLGNFSTLTDLLERTDPRAYRLLVLRSQYRQPLEVTQETIVQAEESLSRLDALSRRLVPGGPSSLEVGPDAKVLSDWMTAMDRDLDTPAALAVCFDAVREANTAERAGEGRRARELASAVVQCFSSVGLELAGVEELPVAVQELMARRAQARAARDFAGADAIRDEIARLGWQVEDGPGGTTAHRGPSR